MPATWQAYRDRLLSTPEAVQLMGPDGLDDDVREKRLIGEYLGNEPGAFVEVGANHPFIGSQSYHLELAGWRGLLVEPLHDLADILRQQRPQAHVSRCVCTRPAHPPTVRLHVPDEHGFATVDPNRDDFAIRYRRTEEVPASTLDQVIEDWRRSTGDGARIRFVSVDVEGHELDVLQGFSLEHHHPDLLLIEDKLQDLDKHRFLAALGYRMVRRTGLNNWYIPAGATRPPTSLGERLRLFRKVYLGLPARRFRRWRHRHRRPSEATPPPPA